MNLINTLEAMAWGEYREVTTVQGPLLVKSMKANSDVWNLWKQPAIQEEMKKSGYTLRKEKDGWRLYRWAAVYRKETKERLLEESRASDTDAELMRPQGLDYRPFQRAGIKYAIDRLFGQNGQRQRNAVLIGDDMGLGKLSNINAKTLTPSGWRKIGDLRVGDKIIDADGMASTITGVFPQGVKPNYEITFSDGSTAHCGPEHLWEVRDGNMATRGKSWKIMTLQQMMDAGLKLKSGANKFEIPQFPGHIETTGIEPNIDAWILGQLIGNGTTGGSDGEIKVTSNSNDKDVITRIEAIGGISKRREGDTTVTRLPIGRCGRIMDTLRELELDCKSKEKSIHQSLLVTPWNYRVELLRGMMDADGSNNKNRITYHTCAPKLAEGIADLVRSLGGAAVIREYDRSTEGKPTEWQVNIHTQFCPFSSARKSKGWKADRRSRGNKIESARYIDNQESVCIMVDHPRHLYVTEGYKLTHNTVQAIGILNNDYNLRDIRVLVVCPASLKLNWRNEMRKWMMDGFGNEVVVVKDKWPAHDTIPARMIIVNYDVLHKWEKEIREEEWDYIIFDEAHYLKNEKARRTKLALGGVLEIKKGEESIMKEIAPIPVKKKIFLTGTPIPNRVMEIWPIVHECDPMGLGANHMHFAKRYGKNNDNLNELQERMRAAFMVRRMKMDVLKELPPKQRSVMSMDPDDYGMDRIFKEEMSVFRQYQELLRTWSIKTELAKAEGIEEHRKILREKKLKLGLQASELAKLRQKTAIAKAPGVIDQVKNVVEEGQKVILFAHHIAVLDKLQEGIEAAEMSFVRIDGSTSMNDRQAAVEKFQAGEIDVFLGGIIPAGVGLTLTRASYVIFAELDWVPGQMTQCEDRAHRMGQLDIVFILHAVMEGSLDEYMAKKLIEKQELIEKALDKHEEGDEDESTEDAAESFAAGDSASTKSASATKIGEEADRMSEVMKDAVRASINKLTMDVPKSMNAIDLEILKSLKANQSDRSLAMARRIARKFTAHLDTEIAKNLDWPKPEKETKDGATANC